MSSQFFRNHILLSPKKFKNNYSYLFDGVNERINIDSVRTALATTTVGTCTCWIKPVDATPAATNTIISFANGNSTDFIRCVILTTGELRSNGFNSGIEEWVLTTNSAQFSDNTWAHIALVQDGTEPVLYVNAVAPAQAFVGSPLDKTLWFNDLVLNNGRIGAEFRTATDGELPFNGNIDEVGFFNTNLTANQISEIYNNGKPRNLLKHSAVSNLVSYFRMGDGDTWDGTNWTLIDKKGTNNGTSVNMEFADNEIDVI